MMMMMVMMMMMMAFVTLRDSRYIEKNNRLNARAKW